jgi:hypothetical protein
MSPHAADCVRKAIAGIMLMETAVFAAFLTQPMTPTTHIVCTLVAVLGAYTAWMLHRAIYPYDVG